MDLPRLVSDTFEAFIRRQGFSREQLRAIRMHERVPLFKANLARDLIRAPKIEKRHLVDAIESLTALFIMMVKREAKERVMSRLAKDALKKEVEARDEFRKAAEVLDEKGADHVFEVKGGEIIQTTHLDPV